MDIKYKLIRSERKTVAITIDKNAGLVVKAPLKTPSSVIEEIVRGKSGWIEKTV